MKGFSSYFLPVIGVAAGLFGLGYVWIGIHTLFERQWGVGVLLTVFGIAGVAMGLALWNAWRQFVKRVRGEPN